MTSRTFLTSGLAALAMTMVFPVALAQGASTYPQRPINVVVPYAPGGSADVAVRAVADELSRQLKQPFVIQNRAGASGLLAAQATLQQPADGYTVLVITSTFAAHKALYKSLPYDMERDFVPTARLVTLPMAILVNTTVPAKDVSDLVRLSRATSGGLSYATAGKASTPHVAAELFRARTQANLVHVPYKGEGPALNDLYGGQVGLMFSGIGSATTAQQSGKAHVLAVTSSRRSEQLPNVPTVAEQGLPGFNVTGWFGFAVRSGTPAAIVQRLNEAVKAALAKPEIAAKLNAMGNSPAPLDPKAFSELVREDTLRSVEALVRAGVEPE